MNLDYVVTPRGAVVDCRKCGVRFTLPVTKRQIEDWKGGKLIQKAMPELPPAERELLISGICGKCFDKAFQQWDDSPPWDE